MRQPTLETIMREFPELTYAGFFVPGLREPGETAIDARERHRARMLEPDARDELELSAWFIARHLEIGPRINKAASSYGLKHRAEEWYAAQGKPVYISNGMFIAAMINQLYRVQPIDINATFNVSPTSMKRLLNVSPG